MKLSRGFVLSSLYAATAVASDARVYTYDSTNTPPAQAPTVVDLDTARLILAQRLGLSRFHAIHEASDRQIKQMNAFGGRQQRLFGGEGADSTQAHVLVWVEGVEDAETVVSDVSQWSSSFTISNPLHSTDNDRLIRDLISQAESLPQKTDRKGNTHTGTAAADAILSQLKPTTVHNDFLTVLHAGKNDELSVSQLATALETLRSNSSGDQGFSITLVVMPPVSVHAKRSAQPYGSYDLPIAHGPRRPLSEAPLAATAKPATISSPNVSDFSSAAQESSNSTTPVLGILPSCFTSLSDCSKRTNSCSGHGECKLFRKAGNGRSDCFSCACKPDIKHVDAGMETRVKTTHWGGPACQKKDVSVPFWLFVGSGILLAFLIASGIGMLYSMGSEELPSVIGAGVSGPVRK